MRRFTARSDAELSLASRELILFLSFVFARVEDEEVPFIWVLFFSLRVVVALAWPLAFDFAFGSLVVIRMRTVSCALAGISPCPSLHCTPLRVAFVHHDRRRGEKLDVRECLRCTRMNPLPTLST